MNKTSRFTLFVFSVLCLALPITVLAADTRLATNSEHGMRATLVLDSAPLVAMRPTRLELQVESPAVTPRQARCEMTMPSMPMPPNRPMLRPLGEYLVGEVIFTMAGEWRASCKIDFVDGSSETFVFELGMVQM